MCVFRHYNEVEVPLRSLNIDNPVSTTSVKNDNSSAIVVDLCNSPKKCQSVQTRLSHFFRKSKNDQICDRDNTEIGKTTNQFCVETNSQSIINNASTSSGSL